MHVAATEPYPWPYDGVVVGPSLALLLAGWDDSWARRSFLVDDVDERCATLAGAVDALGGLVVTVAHGGAVARPVPTRRSLVTAHGIDGFHGGPLDDVLRASGRTHLLVAGFGLEGPVHSTLRSANDRGYECLLVSDACAALTEDLVHASLSTVTMSGGIFGAIGRSHAVLTALTPNLVQETS